MSCSTINLAAVAYTVDTHDANLIANFVNYPVVTNADTPITFATSKLSTAGRSRIVG
jgi:hypothetical protein